MADVLFDMSKTSSSLLRFPMPLVLLGIAAAAVFGLVRKEPERNDSMFGKGRYGLFLLLIALVFAAALAPIILRPWARFSMYGRKTNVVQGCVHDFERVVHPNGHNIADTYFTIGGVDFHFNSSPWLPGFHNENDLIRSGDRLKITRADNTVLRIERLAQGCRSTDR